MLPPAAHPDFWKDENATAYIATNPHRVEDAVGLVEFAAQAEETRALIYFQTSGSEGVPKWVGLARRAMQASARAVNAHLECTAADRWLIALPLHHVGGFSILARCYESGASFFHTEEKWDAAAFASLCAAQEITLASLVPAQVYDLVQSKVEAPSRMRAIVVGGGGLSKELGIRALELGWPVLQSYGMTETASQVATEPLEHLRAGYDPECLEVLPCWNVDTTPEGALMVRGMALASGYAIRNADATWHWQAIDADAGFTARDRVQVWWHGTRRFLRFVGRESSFVKVLGELVSLPALQRRLERVLIGEGIDLRAALIWPVPDTRKDTRLLLVGEGQDKHDAARLENLRARFNLDVPGYERLDAVLVVPAIPRTPLGKVDARGMAELVRKLL
ncbi:AMP-binding protein [Roseimicrobium sp. ORNL1]|uniref:AMP-binding protein n=1 Tax=Roseimicrobium sp. ORNL1 TaxID=2711231 RepID=UPI0013E1FEC3|nr:AMP-binding protein [Roseimicrobium sp. ORNL1]QIF03667.1 AMP-binding protein [Roseimicrobium sp. ORNL1]